MILLGSKISQKWCYKVYWSLNRALHVVQIEMIVRDPTKDVRSVKYSAPTLVMAVMFKTLDR